LGTRVLFSTGFPGELLVKLRGSQLSASYGDNLMTRTDLSSYASPVLLLCASLLAAGSLNAQEAATPAAAPAAAAPAPVPASTPVFVIPAGTKIPLTLKSTISTQTARPGDAVYLTSDFPVIVGGRVVIPAGVFVQGYIDGVQRGGKVKGRAQIMMHFVSMAFPNGVVIALPGAVDNVPGAKDAKVKDKEGLIEGTSNKSQDAKTVGSATLAGASIGGIAGWADGATGIGLGAGAGAGAAFGILDMMMKHGSDITFPAGTNMVMVMQRPLQVQERQLQGMGTLTGYDGPNMTPVNAEQNALPKPKPQTQSN
jgi:type IV secretion system protein VirB10